MLNQIQKNKQDILLFLATFGVSLLCQYLMILLLNNVDIFPLTLLPISNFLTHVLPIWGMLWYFLIRRPHEKISFHTKNLALSLLCVTTVFIGIGLYMAPVAKLLSFSLGQGIMVIVLFTIEYLFCKKIILNEWDVKPEPHLTLFLFWVFLPIVILTLFQSYAGNVNTLIMIAGGLIYAEFSAKAPRLTAKKGAQTKHQLALRILVWLAGTAAIIACMWLCAAYLLWLFVLNNDIVPSPYFMLITFMPALPYLFAYVMLRNILRPFCQSKYWFFGWVIFTCVLFVADRGTALILANCAPILLAIFGIKLISQLIKKY